ncbi:hypothetical protein [Flagellimonas sediminis]|uniref:hypothetical protein n=1 Tax=Flagellimonas sediminis TaxID=2696468 RepID=UPI0028BEA5A4|nr:hypothetical protein [Allomuricauda sediminis]
MSQPNKKIPKSIEKEVRIALMHYPELKDIPIEFRFKKNIKKSVMQAQPTFGALFRSKDKRDYTIFISEKFKITGEEFKTVDVPSDVLVGWLGHEMGHIMDYQHRSGLNLIGFGFRYVLLKEFVKKAERAADSFAVTHGMSDYILRTKRFILDNSAIHPTYKDRIKQYYLSPDEIMEMVEEKDSSKSG